MLKGLIVLNNLYKQTVFPVLSLFTSIGTLLCCALPALLVTLGMGAALAGFISVAPWITVFSKYKIFIFVGAGILLVLSSYFLWINSTLWVSYNDVFHFFLCLLLFFFEIIIFLYCSNVLSLELLSTTIIS